MLVLGWTAKAYFATDFVIRHVKMVYRIALYLHGWGRTFQSC